VKFGARLGELGHFLSIFGHVHNLDLKGGIGIVLPGTGRPDRCGRVRIAWRQARSARSGSSAAGFFPLVFIISTNVLHKDT
jgi:hypothetical protein